MRRVETGALRLRRVRLAVHGTLGVALGFTLGNAVPGGEEDPEFLDRPGGGRLQRLLSRGFTWSSKSGRIYEPGRSGHGVGGAGSGQFSSTGSCIGGRSSSACSRRRRSQPNESGSGPPVGRTRQAKDAASGSRRQAWTDPQHLPAAFPVDHPDFEDAARPALGEVLGGEVPRDPAEWKVCKSSSGPMGSGTMSPESGGGRSEFTGKTERGPDFSGP